MAITYTLTEGTPDHTTTEFKALMSLLKEDKVISLACDYMDIRRSNIDLLTEHLLYGPKNLRSLKLQTTADADASLALLIGALATARNLERLDLSRCHLGPLSISALADLMSVHPRLAVVDIHRNLLGASGAMDVCRHMRHNNAVRELELSNNAIDEDGVRMLADMLRSNRSLVKLNLDTAYDIEPASPYIESMVKTQKNLLEVKGFTSCVLQQALERNRDAAAEMAKQVMGNPAELDAPQLQALGERLAAVSYLLEHEQGVSPEEIRQRFEDVLVQGWGKGVDMLPSMLSVLPVEEVFAMAGRVGNPLTIKDFHSFEGGATPLLEALIQCGAGAELFCEEMGWSSSRQVDTVYHLLPKEQQQRVCNRFQLKVNIDAQTESYGRRTA